MLKKLLIGIGVLVGVVVLALVAVERSFDLGHVNLLFLRTFRPTLRPRMRAKTGHNQ